MDQPPAVPVSTGSMQEPGATHTRLSGRWLLLARVAWLSVAALGITLTTLSIPIFFAQVQQVCTGSASDNACVRPQDLQALKQLGLSPAFAVTIFIVPSLVVILVLIGLGTLLFWRRSAEPRTLFVGFLLMLAGTQFIGLPYLLAVVPPAWWVPVAALGFLTDAGFILFWYLFPNGQFVPRWTRWLALAGILERALVDFFPGSLLSHWPAAVFVLFDLGLYGSVIVAQVSRYRRHSTPVERQQTKWVVLALVTGTLLNLATELVLAWEPVLPGMAHVLVSLALNIIISLAVLLIPLAIALSILRYRLWEIDALVSKLLVYGVLTALLAGVYAGLVIGLQALVSNLTGQASQPLVTVVSTLVIAVLVLPVRRRIQAIIDRRFYRRKYDAEQTLAAFSASLGKEVNLTQLSEQVLAVVRGTMQPTHVSLWLLPPKRHTRTSSQTAHVQFGDNEERIE